MEDTTVYPLLVAEYGPNLFTDPALFRRLCAEADSGLTAKTAGKCTPRDQSVTRTLPPTRRP